MTDYIPSTESVRDHATEYNGLGMDEEDFDRWLVEHDRQVAEKAWHEGRSGGLYDGRARNNVTFLDRLNPYRKAES